MMSAKRTKPKRAVQKLRTGDSQTWMKYVAGTWPKNIGPSDVVWVGEDGELDPEKILRDHGYDSFSPLELLVRAIVAGNPDGREANERVEEALQALIGKKRVRGRKRKEDDDILLEIAWRYHEHKFRGAKDLDLGPLIRQCLVDLRARSFERTPDGEHPEVQRLRDRFVEQKDILLTRVTSKMDEERSRVFVLLAHVAKALQQSGVKLEPDIIWARFHGQAGKGV